jgi:putative phosphonate metabolism protein
MSEARYALYFVPPADSALYRFGASALGYDCYTARDLPSLTCEGIDAMEWLALTAEPRTYGFHATLKAPFYLHDDFAEGELITELAEFATRQATLSPFMVSLGILDGFAALTPAAPVPTLDALAAQCVRDFDRFRAPLTETERKRRLKHKLTDRQVAHLDRWGYPYVFEDFRFHMTLSGRLPSHRNKTVLDCLHDALRPRQATFDVTIDAVALLRQDNSSARFKILHAAGFAGTTANPTDRMLEANA